MYLLIISGLSGAGKSLALHSLEEQGYFCVDTTSTDEKLVFNRTVDLKSSWK